MNFDSFGESNSICPKKRMRYSEKMDEKTTYCFQNWISFLQYGGQNDLLLNNIIIVYSQMGLKKIEVFTQEYF